MKYFTGTTIVPAFKIVVICSSSMELGINFSMKIFELLAIKVIPDLSAVIFMPDNIGIKTLSIWLYLHLKVLV